MLHYECETLTSLFSSLPRTADTWDIALLSWRELYEDALLCFALTTEQEEGWVQGGGTHSILYKYSEIMLSRASAGFRPEGADEQGRWADYLPAPG